MHRKPGFGFPEGADPFFVAGPLDFSLRESQSTIRITRGTVHAFFLQRNKPVVWKALLLSLASRRIMASVAAENGKSESPDEIVRHPRHGPHSSS